MTQNNEESFAEMFEASLAQAKDDIRTGEKITGTIISIGANTVFVDTGTKVDGVVDKEELLDKEGNLTVAEGDSIELYVVGTGGNEIRLSRAMSGIGGQEMLEEAFAGGVPVEGKVKGTVKGGFEVTVMQRRAFCPISQIDTRFVENPDEYVGQEFRFKIIKLEQRARNIVVSRRALLEEEQAEARESFVQETTEGDVFDGRVVRVEPFGAFVEITPGVEGMVHVSELSWTRVSEAGDLVKPGDTLKVAILSMEPDKKRGGMRIALSAKKAMGDPWDNLPEEIAEGARIPAVITRTAKFGAFAELAPGIEGLIHISELSYTQRVYNAEDVVKPGEKVTVAVKSVDLDARRIGLSLKDAEGDPWAEVGEQFPVGSLVKGVVEKQEDFGTFINLAPGITGLMPKSLARSSARAADFESARPGAELEVKVHDVDPGKRRLTLAPEDAEDEGAWAKDYARSQAKAQPATSGDSGGMGLLAEKLQEAMKKK